MGVSYCLSAMLWPYTYICRAAMHLTASIEGYESFLHLHLASYSNSSHTHSCALQRPSHVQACAAATTKTGSRQQQKNGRRVT